MPRPVFIDLYFTLIEPDPAYNWATLAAPLLGIDDHAFHTAAGRSYQARMVGTYRQAEEIVDQTLSYLGITVTPEVHATLTKQRLEFFSTLRVYPDTIPTLQALRDRGHQIALVTNCSAETIPMMEPMGLLNLFDAIAYSCDVRSAKPEPGIYQHAIDALGVDPREVVYVGDGDTQEHAGAAKFGMTTVLLQRPGAKVRAVQTDYVISSLTELLDLAPLSQGA
ncbi:MULTISPECIES: HAD family hydrolase [Herpetosiphon]|uniref:HAD family hydrolase n=1 Tax=Herpetosiphon TaxID=64 RepID=UPI0013E0BA4D|nr:HAD family hydrolase [Herpetosiphon llansteffanensis]MBM7842669.1 putative hydrolase of the HAD superfamily [Herpetosiphon giganteus]